MPYFFRSPQNKTHIRKKTLSYRVILQISAIVFSLTGMSNAPQVQAQSFTGTSVFACGDITGTVYNDANRNGYRDEGERGLPGIRRVTMTGLVSTTDRHGRYHITCADKPAHISGANFAVKPDTRSLPAGYRVTGENPRAPLLSAGKVTKINFGAAQQRVVNLDLTEHAFSPAGTQLDPQWNKGVDRLLEILAEKPAILRLTYYDEGGQKPLTGERVRGVSALIKSRWLEQGEPYPLDIERRIFRK